MTAAEAARLLAGRYGSQVHCVRRGGRDLAAAVAPWLEDRPVERTLRIEPGGSVPDAELLAAGRPLLERVKARSPGLHDGAVVAFDRVEDGMLVCRRGRYLEMLATCDALRDELEHAKGARLPSRELAERAAGDTPFRSGRGRVAALGVAVACVLPDPPRVLLGRRRSDLATDPGCWHVAPSGMLEPDSRPVLAAVERELQEELGVRLTARELERRLEALGVGWDLTRLRPELCLRLNLLADEAERVELSESEFELRREIELSDEALAEILSGDATALTPAAAATLALLGASSRTAE